MKKLRSIICILIMVVITMSMAPTTAFAASDAAMDAANKLYNKGLFQGTGKNADGTPNFDLDRAPTRNEAVTMLVRMLGKEYEAKTGSWDIPFTDVVDWAKPYVGYAYTNGLTTGTGSTTYGGDQTVTAAQYITFVLRSLGYKDGVDFQWNKSWELSDKIGFTNHEYNETTTDFTRGDVALISYKALSIGYVPVDSIELNESSLSMEIGESVTLTATVSPADATEPDNITWSSLHSDVANVSNGTVTALSPGSATIYAVIHDQWGWYSASCTVVVTAPQPEPTPTVTWFPEGEYRVGTDIPAGEYYAEQASEYAGYYCLYVDKRKDDIEENNNFRNYDFFSASEGQLLKLTRCKVTQTSNVASSIAKQEGGYYIEGSYRVGIDIPAGEYQFITTDAKYSGYYCAYSDITKDDIVDNDNFKGSAYYTVTDGQLLQVNRAKFILIGETVPSEGQKNDKKWSIQDAHDLSNYISSGSKFVNTANDYALEAFERGNTSIRIANLKLGLSAAQTAQLDYKAALELLKNRVELTYTTGSSVTEDVQSIYDTLDQLSQISADGNIEDTSSEFAHGLMEILPKQVRVLKAVSQLLEAFL